MEYRLITDDKSQFVVSINEEIKLVTTDKDAVIDHFVELIADLDTEKPLKEKFDSAPSLSKLFGL